MRGGTGFIGALTGAIVASALTVSASAAAPASAAASEVAGKRAPSSSGRIVYVCGADLCSVDPRTGSTDRLTTDGRGYYRPSVSADGTRIAAAAASDNIVEQGPELVVGDYGSNLTEVLQDGVRGLKDVAISPDGTQVAASWWYTELKYEYCYPGPSCLNLYHYSAASVWTGQGSPVASHRGNSGVGYAGSGLLSVDSDSGTYDPASGTFVGATQIVCLVASPLDDDATCDRRVVEPSPQTSGGPRIKISDPVASPDGRLVAAVVGDVPAEAGRIVDDPTGLNPRINVYDAATGAKLAQAAANGFSPSFSPDGKQLVYQGTDGMVYVVAATGGTPRALVAGLHPTWGTTPGGTPAATLGKVAKPKSPLRAKGRKVSLAMTCPKSARPGACRGTAQLTTRGVSAKRRTAITSRRSYRVAPGRTVRVTLPVTGKGGTVLRRSRTTKALAVLRAGDGASVVTKVKVRR